MLQSTLSSVQTHAVTCGNGVQVNFDAYLMLRFCCIHLNSYQWVCHSYQCVLNLRTQRGNVQINQTQWLSGLALIQAGLVQVGALHLLHLHFTSEVQGGILAVQ